MSILLVLKAQKPLLNVTFAEPHPAVRQFDARRPVTAAEPEVQGAARDLQPCAEFLDGQQIVLPRRLTL